VAANQFFAGSRLSDSVLKGDFETGIAMTFASMSPL
jgi:hypothetical protein